SLSPERIDRAIVRLLELGLVYEVLVPDTTPAPNDISTETVEAFLSQSETDPVTVMASQEMLERTARNQALSAAVDQVVAEVGRRQAPGSKEEKRTAERPAVAVPLTKLFPQNSDAVEAVLPLANEAARVSEELKALRKKANEQIQLLESELATKKSASYSASKNGERRRSSSSRKLRNRIPIELGQFSDPRWIAAGAAVAVFLLVVVLVQLIS
ncbi:MAG TPA: hypothetical protein VFS42_08715, partial [Burkholderiaceae bacterium]|nr:hypothetical protein [Burkholderiaceae bacterium]